MSDDGTVQTRRVTSGYRAEAAQKPDFVDKSESVTDGVTEDNRDEVLRQLPITDNPNKTIESIGKS